MIFAVGTKCTPTVLELALVEAQVWAVEPDEIVGLCDPLEDFLQQHTYATPEFSVMISAPLAGISLLLVVIGIFSVLAYTVSLQTHEIGIRMALGARQASILRMILAKGAGLIAAGMVIGLFASYGLTRFLASQIWGVSVMDVRRGGNHHFACRSHRLPDARAPRCSSGSPCRTPLRVVAPR